MLFGCNLYWVEVGELIIRQRKSVVVLAVLRGDPELKRLYYSSLGDSCVRSKIIT